MIAGLAVVWMLTKAATRTRTRPALFAVGAGRVAGSLLLLVVTGFLIASGAPLISSSSDYPTSTPAVNPYSMPLAIRSSAWEVRLRTLQLWGSWQMPTSSTTFRSSAAYDPLTPHAYFSLYKTPTSVLDEFVDIFSPAITSTQAARLYGISYVLEPSGVPGPKGSVFVRKLGDEDLYRVPGAAAATLVGLRPDGSLPGKYASGAPVRVTHPKPGTWRMVTNTTTPSVLRLRLTDVPGWRATIDGKPVDVSSFARIMLQVRVPPGRHVVELQYWPKTFSVGIILAFCAVFGLAVLLILAWIRSRRLGHSEKAA